MGHSIHPESLTILAISSERAVILGALVLAVVALGVAIFLLVIQKVRVKPTAKSTAAKADRSSIASSQTHQVVKHQPSVQGHAEQKRPFARPKSKRILPSREEAALAEDAGDYSRAATVWTARGNRTAQLRTLQQAGDEIAVADLEIALGWESLAVARLENLLRATPGDMGVRRRLFEAYLDQGEVESAKATASAILEDPQYRDLNHLTLWQFGRGFELIGDRDTALRLYEVAARQPESPNDLEVRGLYLSEMNRLQAPSQITSSSGEQIAREIIAIELGDTTQTRSIVRPTNPTEMLDAELRAAAGEPPKTNQQVVSERTASHRNAIPREVIVGHLALGGEMGGVRYPARSRSSMASRYQFKRLVNDSQSTALFEGVDKLLDCPVAIKLSHISLPHGDFELLRDRLRVISSVNHPNLTKTTFVDREGNVVRVVTDFHSGGSLHSMLSRMEQIGLPLMLRLVMQVASGVHAAHSHGVIHGDLRTENIMIGHDQLIKVSDFALHPWPVRRLGPDDSRSRDILQLFPPDEIQLDIKRFADLLDQLLLKTVVSSVLAGNFDTGDPLEELAEVARRAREGAFSSLTPIQKILQQVMEGIQPMGRSN